MTKYIKIEPIDPNNTEVMREFLHIALCEVKPGEAGHGIRYTMRVVEDDENE